MLESGEIRLQSAQKNLRRKLQLFSTTGSVALWSETKLQNHNATVLQLISFMFHFAKLQRQRAY
jgi:hypothetical protein